MRMTTNQQRFQIALGAMTAIALSVPTHAATLYWDTNGNATGTGTTIPVGTGSGYGTWGTDQFWSTSLNGTIAPGTTNTTSIDILNFSAGTNAPSAYSVSVTGSQAAATINFQEGDVTLSGTAISFADSGTMTSGAGDSIINNAITGAATQLTVNANNATGSITLAGANSYSGLTIIGNLATGGVAGSQVILAGSNSSAGDTRINNVNTLVLNSASNGGLASGSLILGHATSSSSTNSPILRNDTGSALSLTNLIAFPNFTSWVVFDGTNDIRFTNTGTINTAGFNTTTQFPTDAPRIFYVTDVAMTVTIDGVLDDVGLKSDNNPAASAINKRGAGRLVLTADHVYDGLTNVYEGTLQIDGSVATYVNVSGGTLAGTGTLYGRATIDGTLAVGDEDTNGGIGTMTFDYTHASLRSLLFFATGVAHFQIDGLTAGTYDLAKGSADAGAESVTFDGTLNLEFASGFNTPGTIKIFDFDSYAGSFASVQVTGLASGYEASFDPLTGEVLIALIPEPSSLILAGLGLVVMGCGGRGRRC